MMLPTNVSGVTSTIKPTMELRIVNGKLEQKWIDVSTGEEVWRAVQSFDKKGNQNG